MFVHEQAAEKVRVLRREAALERALPAIWRVQLAQVLWGAAERLDFPCYSQSFKSISER